MTEVQNIFSAQKDDPFFDIIENKNQAQLHFLQLKTKFPIESFIDGMTLLQAPEIPKSKTGSNPFKEDESEVNKFERRASQVQGVRLNDEESMSVDNNNEYNEEMDSKQAFKPNRNNIYDDGADDQIDIHDFEMTYENNGTNIDITNPDIMFKSSSSKKVKALSKSIKVKHEKQNKSDLSNISNKIPLYDPKAVQIQRDSTFSRNHGLPKQKGKQKRKELPVSFLKITHH